MTWCYRLSISRSSRLLASNWILARGRLERWTMRRCLPLSEHVSGGWAEGNVTERVVSLQHSGAHKYTPALWANIPPSIFSFMNNLARSYFCYPIIWIWSFETQVNLTQIEKADTLWLGWVRRKTHAARTFISSSVTGTGSEIHLHIYGGHRRVCNSGSSAFPDKNTEE